MNTDQNTYMDIEEDTASRPISTLKYDEKNHCIATKGVILQSIILSTGPSGNPVLNRKRLLNNTLYEEPITPYVPPIFLLIMYEKTPHMRYTFYRNEQTEVTANQLIGSTALPQTCNANVCADGNEQDVKVNNTKFVLKENISLIKGLLQSADCIPNSMQQCFLRLEHAGSLQSMMEESFPVPALKIGCLARLAFESLRKRTYALNYLHDNSSSNSDVYAINYSSNSCATTLTRYLEPLFKHSMEIQNAWSTDAVKETGIDDGIFDVNFHLLDLELKPKTIDDQNNRPIFISGSADRRSTQEVRTKIKERTSHTSPLTVHDVSNFFKQSAFYGDRNAAAQLQYLPVVYIRYERDFVCLSACTEYNREHVLLHAYYVWTESLANSLTKLSASVNASSKNNNFTTRMCVCGAFENKTMAFLKMLDDAKTCFWKKHANSYIRLVSHPTQDDMIYSRFVLYTLLTQEISSSKVSLQSHIEGCRKTIDGCINLFPNSIALDCAKLTDEFDDSVCEFAAAYKRNKQDAASYTNTDGATNVPENVLRVRQNNVGIMLLKFKEEHIAELAYNMANDLYLGILDLYGASAPKHAEMRFDPISNYLFVHALVNGSIYTSSSTFDTDLHALVKKENAEDSKLIPTPFSCFQEGIHYAQEDKEICEFDIVSAYPTIIETFNISPETTVVMRKIDIDNVTKKLQGMFMSKGEGAFQLKRWYFVVPYVEAPEELAVVSLIPCVYKGCMSSALRSLVLKRRTNAKIASHFYKRVANKLCGCMARKESDLYAINCLAATSSLCQTVVKVTLENLKNTVKVLRVQTDGGILQATKTIDSLAMEIRRVFINTVDSLLDKDVTKCCVNDSLFQLKVEGVNMCFIANQNKYAVRYYNGRMVMKGHDSKVVPSLWAERAVTEAVFKAVDTISQAGYECTCKAVIAIMMEVVCKHMLRTPTNNVHDDTDDLYFFERVAPFEDRTEEKRIMDIGDFKYDQNCRFGDTVPLWPVVIFEGETLTRAFASKPTSMGPSVIVDRFAVLRQLMNAWILEVCRSQCCDFCTDGLSENNYARLFNQNLWRVGMQYCNEVYNRIN